jgi:ParB family chromosome partitioning protein
MRPEAPLDAIQVNPNQPRHLMDEAALTGLADSIRAYGVLQAVVVRRLTSGYELVAGERRLRAARLAGLTQIPISIVEAEGSRSLELALIENIQRENLGALEEADAYEAVLDRTGWTHQQLADRMGKSRAAITNALRLQELPDEVKALVQAGQLSAGQARAVLGMDGREARMAMASQAARDGLSVREVERLVRERREGAQVIPAEKPAARQAITKPLEAHKAAHYIDELRNLFGTKVTIVEQEGRGEVRLAFFGDEDRDRLLHALLTADPEA